MTSASATRGTGFVAIAAPLASRVAAGGRGFFVIAPVQGAAASGSGPLGGPFASSIAAPGRRILIAAFQLVVSTANRSGGLAKAGGRRFFGGSRRDPEPRQAGRRFDRRQRVQHVEVFLRPAVVVRIIVVRIIIKIIVPVIQIRFAAGQTVADGGFGRAAGGDGVPVTGSVDRTTFGKGTGGGSVCRLGGFALRLLFLRLRLGFGRRFGRLGVAEQRGQDVPIIRHGGVGGGGSGSNAPAVGFDFVGAAGGTCCNAARWEI